MENSSKFIVIGQNDISIYARKVSNTPTNEELIFFADYPDGNGGKATCALFMQRFRLKTWSLFRDPVPLSDLLTDHKLFCLSPRKVCKIRTRVLASLRSLSAETDHELRFETRSARKAIPVREKVWDPTEDLSISNVFTPTVDEELAWERYQHWEKIILRKDENEFEWEIA